MDEKDVRKLQYKAQAVIDAVNDILQHEYPIYIVEEAGRSARAWALEIVDKCKLRLEKGARLNAIKVTEVEPDTDDIVF